MSAKQPAKSRPKAETKAPAMKFVKLTRRQRVWETEEQQMPDPRASSPKKIVMQSFKTVCFTLPKETAHIEAITINKRVVYSYQGRPSRSSVIGGGGRFVHQKSYYYGALVHQTLRFLDLPYTGKEPVIEVLVSFQEEDGEKGNA